MKKHFAFTMIELTFVIVVMGIIGKFGVEFLAQAYKSFVNAKVNSELQANSEFTIDFIVKRLRYRIKDSVIARTDINATALVSITDASGDAFKILEWIGVDDDGFRGDALPNWSGIIDLDKSDTNSLVSPQTDTSSENVLIQVLSNNNSDINSSALYFMGSNSDIQSGYGWNGLISDQNQTMHPINSDSNISKFVPAIGTGGFHNVTEYYKLAWTAYAIELNTTSNELFFYYNFQPWNGDIPENGNKTLLMQNVSSFRFIGIGSIIKIQVCIKSDLVEEYSLCKEKTVF